MIIIAVITYVLIAWVTLVFLKLIKWESDDGNRFTGALVWPILLIGFMANILYSFVIASTNKATSLIEALFEPDDDEESE